MDFIIYSMYNRGVLGNRSACMASGEFNPCFKNSNMPGNRIVAVHCRYFDPNIVQLIL